MFQEATTLMKVEYDPNSRELFLIWNPKFYELKYRPPLQVERVLNRQIAFRDYDCRCQEAYWVIRNVNEYEANYAINYIETRYMPDFRRMNGKREKITKSFSLEE